MTPSSAASRLGRSPRASGDGRDEDTHGETTAAVVCLMWKGDGGGNPVWGTPDRERRRGATPAAVDDGERYDAQRVLSALLARLAPLHADDADDPLQVVD